MDADVPTPDRVDLDPHEVDDEFIAPDDRLDLDAIEADLAGVEVALARLSDGTYWTDEVNGEPLGDELLASSPTARRA